MKKQAKNFAWIVLECLWIVKTYWCQNRVYMQNRGLREDLSLAGVHNPLIQNSHLGLGGKGDDNRVSQSWFVYELILGR